MAATRLSSPSAAMLRRLAEAVDGYRDGKRHWFIAREGARVDLKGAFNSLAAARAAKRAAGRGYQVFGPFRTPADGGTSVVKVALTMRDRKGRESTRTWRPKDGCDAMVFTQSAYDKFFAPYYARLVGLDEARKMRWALSDDPFNAVVHLFPTIYEEDKPSLLRGATTGKSSRRRRT